MNLSHDELLGLGLLGWLGWTAYLVLRSLRIEIRTARGHVNQRREQHRKTTLLPSFPIMTNSRSRIFAIQNLLGKSRWFLLLWLILSDRELNTTAQGYHWLPDDPTDPSNHLGDVTSNAGGYG